jgi:hypothetical protein
MDLHKTSEGNTVKRTEIIVNDEFVFSSSYSTLGLSLREEMVEIKKFTFTQPSQIIEKNNLDINIVYPIKEIRY